MRETLVNYRYDVPMPGGHAEILAGFVSDRRKKQLNMSFAAIAAAGGLSKPTMVKVEAGKITNPKTVTFDRLDKSLRWVPGSAAAAYWNAAEPARLEDEQRESESLRLTGGAVEIPIERISGLMEIQADLHAILEGGSELKPSTLRGIAAGLDHEVNLIVGQWVSDMMARNRTQEGTLHAGLEVVLGEALSAPVASDDPNAEDRLHRRYLAGGKYAENIPADLQLTFERRDKQQRR
ncbi:hypothetical protein [Nocardia sp. XZ_19_231]|uniref:hypothetical protein n=1 Tax=Nocardia sp. XZ_19_231 TaxID=2769252 RepID=UPI0018908B9B|nr:hypothetical protein [Nocardia sp. XZ_19_231]